MKVLERIALVLFSIIILVIAVTGCLVALNLVELKEIYKVIDNVLQDQNVRYVVIGACAIAILLAIKSLFFPSKTNKRQELKSGVLLENKDGRLLISKDTIENLVNSVVKGFDEAVDVQTKITLDVENNITVFISLLVKEESIIKDLSSSIQNKIKETIKRSTDLDVNQVNINIKDIENNKNNNQTKIKVNNIQVNNNKTNETKSEETTALKQNETASVK